MVYQRATVKLQTSSDQDISKAMQIVTKTNGRIISMQMQGQERDQLVVIGEFDSTKLIELLRKKFRRATLMSLQPITALESSSSSSNYNNNNSRHHQYEYYPNYNPITMASNNSAYYHQQQWPSSSSSSSSNYYFDADYPYRVVHDSEPSACSIM